MENTRISKKLLTFPRNQLKSNEFRYDCIYFARIFKKLFTFSTPKKRMPYALNEANFKNFLLFSLSSNLGKRKSQMPFNQKTFTFYLQVFRFAGQVRFDASTFSVWIFSCLNFDAKSSILACFLMQLRSACRRIDKQADKSSACFLPSILACFLMQLPSAC